MIPYFQNSSQKLLKKMYYMGEVKFYEIDNVIFDTGSPCEYMYFVI